ARDSERDEVFVGTHRSSCDRGHASVDRVEAVRAVHEVCRTLRRAADPAELGYALGLDAHFVHGVNDALGDGVVSATGAKRGLAAAVVDDLQAYPVYFWFGRAGGSGSHLFALHHHEFVGYGTGVNRQSVNVADRTE